MNTQPENELSLLALANVEALASGESDCVGNTNGYKKWKTSAGIFGGRSEQFYDCCSVLREGYSPSANCN